jgi:hypothetical protein
MPVPATTASSDYFYCPVCRSPFMHRQSFEGHIRRLLTISTSDRCFLDETNNEHQRLVAHPRYGDGSFDDRRHQFAEQFYSTVRSHFFSRQCWPNTLRAVGFCCVDFVAPIASHHAIETCRRSMSGCLVESRTNESAPRSLGGRAMLWGGQHGNSNGTAVRGGGGGGGWA